MNEKNLKGLVKEYLDIKLKLDSLKSEESMLKKEVHEMLTEKKQSFVFDNTKITFSKSKDSIRVKYDTDAMAEDGLDIEKYKKVTTVKGSYRATIKPIEKKEIKKKVFVAPKTEKGINIFLDDDE